MIDWLIIEQNLTVDWTPSDAINVINRTTRLHSKLHTFTSGKMIKKWQTVKKLAEYKSRSTDGKCVVSRKHYGAINYKSIVKVYTQRYWGRAFWIAFRSSNFPRKNRVVFTDDTMSFFFFRWKKRFRHSMKAISVSIFSFLAKFEV